MNKRPSWQGEGKTPDYRFSLANERTFLAWIRTALAFLAGAVGLDQLAPEFASPPVRVALTLLLSIGAAILSIMAYRRWVNNERAMRMERDMPYTRLLYVIVLSIAVVALIFILLIIRH